VLDVRPEDIILLATENDADRIIKHIRISDEDEIEVEPKTRTIVVDGVEQEEKVGPEFY
jgi:hypothetical protein